MGARRMGVCLARLAGYLGAAFLVTAVLASGSGQAQSRIRDMPGYERWAAIAPQIPGSVKPGAIAPKWAADSRSFEYTLDGALWRYDVSRRVATRIGAAEPPARPVQPASGAPSEPAPLVLARGRGADADVRSPDGKLRAFSRDLNLYVAPTATGGAAAPEIAISRDGSAQARIRNGTGSYVYLEEFNVRSPVWWSPDSRKIAWMRYDEGAVDDYFTPLDQTKKFSRVLTQAYPHPGAANPVADLMVHDLDTGATRRMDAREGQPFANDVVGHYTWAAEWTKAGDEILVRRADRLQKVFDLAACRIDTGACRSVARETRAATWADGAAPHFLADGRRFIWQSERTDFNNLYLYDLSGRQLATLTKHAFDVVDIVKVDERQGVLWYTARSGDNHMKVQLHRVRLDGGGERRLTDPALTHRVTVSPDGRYIIDVAQAHDRPPATQLLDDQGRRVAFVADSQTADYDRLGLKRSEMFTFTSADGQTRLHGMIDFPSDFDPARRYPVLLSVYGGPATNGASETFALPSTLTELGFLVVRMDARTAGGRGRRMLDAIYKQFTVTEVDDFAAGIRALAARPYVDPDRVGVYGTSYGGTVSAALLMRYPDLVRAAVSNSPVTDYRLYDTAYSERYLGLPDVDADAYDRAALLTYAPGLKGDLMLYFGTSDDNVHPKNALQLIRLLQSLGKSFDLQVGPDRGHTSVDQTRMMEFFIERLGAPGARARD